MGKQSLLTRFVISKRAEPGTEVMGRFGGPERYARLVPVLMDLGARITGKTEWHMARERTPTPVETEVLVRSRRWCALCFGLNLEAGPKTQGQIAHVDRDPANSDVDNLCWLCLPHHDLYDTRPSQSKRLTPAELRSHRDDLYAHLAQQRSALLGTPQVISMSGEAWTLAKFVTSRSRSGRKLDAQVRLDVLPSSTGLSVDDVEIAVDELISKGLVELNGAREAVYATDRFFWETDPLFTASDPASDAAVVARLLVERSSGQVSTAELASQLQWDARRLNPAVTYLHSAGYVGATPVIGSPYWAAELRAKPSTKRFVRDLDASLVPRST